MITYLCEDTPEGIFTAVYDAWAAKIPDDGAGNEFQSVYGIPAGGNGSGKSSQGGTFHPAEDRK